MNRQQVVAEYQGHIRQMCPHVIGSKRSREKALFYQFGGTSSRGLGPIGSSDNWRCIFLDRLRIIEARDGPWHTAWTDSWVQYSQDCVDLVDAQVTPRM